MVKEIGAGWSAYDSPAELLAELDLTDEDMAQARQVTEDHIRACDRDDRLT
ncbi:hypothetical protein [Dactylosporangium sp. CA-092794]|uniref:hypothetical protein n=1 Tax=Dactylosporangium sp. CA-092794 TaxID=3239929 RepID=UPI003D914DF1